jgi:glycosyltransferase involved in cell wall biosynthesis
VSAPRVLVMTTVHVADDARIAHREIPSMVAAGWHVTYAAPLRATTARLPTSLAGVELIDLPRARGRRRLRALVAAVGLLRRRGPDHDLVVVHDPDLVVAVALAGPRRLPPVVWDVHEDVAASLPERGWLPRPLVGPAVRAARRLERWAERHLHLVLAEEGYRARFRGEHPVVRNLPPAPVARSGGVSSAGADGLVAGERARVVHVGRISRGRGAVELLDLGRRLAGRGVALELVGTPDDDVADVLAAAVAAGAVRWHGRVPNDRIGEVLGGAVAGLCLLHDLPNYRVSMPTKVLEYLVHDLPVVATPLPEVVALAERLGGIVTVPFDDVTAVEAAVIGLVADPAERERLAAVGARARRELAWEPEGERLVALLAGWARR